MAHRYVPLPIATTTAAGAITGEGGVPATFGGYTFRNTSASAVQVDIYDNASTASGTLLATLDLTAKGSVGACATYVYDEGGVKIAKGIYYNPSAGSAVQGAIFVA